MTQRSFDDAFWGDTFVQTLDKDAKYLFAYLWTNKHVNSACLYEITCKTISFDTGINECDLPNLFDALREKVTWYPDKNIVWVKNFVKRQPKSPQFLKAIARALITMNQNGDNPIIGEFLEYNQKAGVCIPYLYPIDTISGGYGYRADPSPDIEENINNNTTVNNDTSTKKIYGEFQNVKLVDIEYEKLLNRYGEKQVKVMIESLSAYMKSKKKRYSSHYATLLNWFRREEKDNAGTGKDKPLRLPGSYTHPEDL